MPKGTPPAIVARLNDEMNKALKDPKLLENFNKGVVEPVGGTGRRFGQARAADSEKYAKLVKELGIKASG